MSEPNAASVAILRGGDVLLIQRATEPLKGLWTLPGGRREPGESILATAIREIAEETGLRIDGLQPVRQMGVGGRFTLQVFVTRDFAGEVTASVEIAAWRWATPEALADLPTTPGLDHVLRRAFAIAAENVEPPDDR